MRRVIGGTLAALAVAFAQPSACAEQPIPVPADPIAAKAFAVLERHCARCHQDGRLTRATACVEVMPSGLSSTTQPWIRFGLNGVATFPPPKPSEQAKLRR